MPARFLTLCVSMLACCVGCKNDSISTYPIEGQVSLDGEPLRTGLIAFGPVAEGLSAIGEVRDGAIVNLKTAGELTGVIAGEHVVRIFEEVSEAGAGAARVKIPATYGGEESPLRARVEPAGVNRFVFELTSK